MAEIPLQDYIATIEGQLSGAAADEAMYHSRHLLSHYPKYTPAYRLLGRALLLKGQHDEAEAAFRRVLSVEPNDRTAHLGLSDIYDRRHRGDEAIWHAERALELDAANQAASDAVHNLYRRYHGQERPRMGLTAVTLARQAIQNRDFDQAVQTLRSAIERQPERVDLKLLLAEALWASGDHISGAEAAQDVLDVLPDCLQANTILSQLWLENGRPSDARPFLNRLESLDPYAALALVTGQPAEASAFTIEPLDYQRSAQSDVARVEPDWLQGLPGAPPPSADTPAEAPDWISGMLATAEIPASRLPDASRNDLTSTTLTPLPASAEEAEELPELAALTSEPASLDDLFGGIGEALLEAPDAELPAPDPFAGATPADDILPDLETLFGEGQETPSVGMSPFDFSEPAPPPPPAGVTASLQSHDPASPARMPPAEDALAWLRESGVELVEDEAPVLDSDLAAGFPLVESSDTLDPMAWLNSYDTVLAEIDTRAEDETPPAAAEGTADDDWQSAPWDPNAVDLDAFTSEADQPATAEDELAVSSSGAPALRGLTSRLGDPALTPPAPALPPALAEDAVLDEWLSQFDTPSAAEPDQANPEWLTDLGVTMSNEPESTPIEPDSEDNLPLPADESADWLKDLQPEDENHEQAEPILPADDWMTNLESAPQPTGETLPDWLTETALEAPTSAAEEPAPVAASEEFDWLDSLSAPADEPAEAVDEAVMAAQADVPDWLNALEAEALATIDANMATPEPESTAAADEAAAAIEALPFDEPVETAEPVEAAFEAALDEKQPVEAGAESVTGEVEPAAELPTLELELDAAAAAFIAASESEAAPEPPPAQDWGEPEMADLSRIAPPTVGLGEFEPAPAEPVSPDDWFADSELATEAPVPAEGSVPAAGDDWFTDAELQAPAVEVEAAAGPEAEAAGWQSELEPEAAVTQLGRETIVMAGELTESEEAAAASEAVLSEDAAETPLGMLAFGADDELETASGKPLAEEPGDETEAWLGEEWPEEHESPFLSPDELDELPDAEIVDETQIAPAANAPDWLNAMVPGLDMDFGAAEDEPLEREFAEPTGALDTTLGARSEYAWVIDLVEQEEHETAPAPVEAELELAAETADEPRYVFSRLPAWFRASNDDDDDFADWPGDDSSLPAWQN